MTLDIVGQHEERLAAQIAQMQPNRQPTPNEVEAIAKYAVVADELEHEPFMSPDSHDGLVFVGAEKKMHARFGHPAFLKSALMPFRKLWMRSEPCHFATVRDLLFELFGEKTRPADFLTPQVSAYRLFYEGPHERSLAEPLEPLLATQKVKTVEDLINVWLNTHVVHTGKTERLGRFELKDFDEVLAQAGRARFEAKFRTSLHLIGYNSYLSLNRVLVRPIFSRLLQLGYTPSFETRAALKFGPYPKQEDEIRLDDPFWHLDKESEEETFDRLLKRDQFSNFGTFFSGYFGSRRTALDALKVYASLDFLLQATDAVLLEAPDAGRELRSNFHAKGDMNNNAGQVKVYQSHAVHFGDRSRLFLNHYYRQLRETLLAHRETIPSRMNYWDGNWWGN